MDETKPKNSEGFAINSWSNLVSFASVCLMALGGISWGLKLEARIDRYAEQQITMRERALSELSGAQTLSGVKMQAMDDRITKVEQDLDECKGLAKKAWRDN